MKHGRLIASFATTGLVGGSLLLGIPAASATPGTDHPGKADRSMGKSMGTSMGTSMGKAVGKSMDKPNKPGRAARTVELQATLSDLNFSGASGSATATVKNQKIEHIAFEATGLSPDGPHAVHIHYGDDARNECPIMAAPPEGDATNTRADGTLRLSTADGLPAYGPIVVALTTTGDTTPELSALALDRFPVAQDGVLTYERSHIEFTDVADTGYAGGGTAKQIADSIREGEGVLVIHGVDYNDNGMYDFDSAGASELDASLPAEGTDPTLCGVLEPHSH